MTVYVDNMEAGYGRMKMCHMLADTDAELHAMAEHIGVARRWWQSPAKSSGSHYDIAKSKRALAVAAGAVEITLRQAAAMNRRRLIIGELGPPDDAVEWVVRYRGFMPMVMAPKDGTEIEILFRHINWQYAAANEREEWEQVCRAHWIDFNGGGWVWHGICGVALCWRALNCTRMQTEGANV